MSVSTNLQTAIDAEITSKYLGSLAEIGNGLNLPDLLDLQSKLSAITGGGPSSISANTSIEYNVGAATSKTQRVAIALGQLVPAFTLSTINLGAANAATIKASAGAVYSLKVTNKNASVRYFQLVNKATTPTGSDSALIVDVIAIPPNAMVIIDSSYFGVTGLVCSIGVSWAFSSTDTTITLATAGDIISTVGYL